MAAAVPTGGVRRLLAILGGLLVVVSVPLALARPTAWLLLPAHLALTVIATCGALAEGLRGRAERARLWGFGYLTATLLVVGTLELAARVRGVWAGYWGPAWVALLLWGWFPPLVAGMAGMVGDARARRRTARAVRRRKAQKREI